MTVFAYGKGAPDWHWSSLQIGSGSATVLEKQTERTEDLISSFTFLISGF
jgi:hypothetical protein